MAYTLAEMKNHSFAPFYKIKHNLTRVFQSSLVPEPVGLRLGTTYVIQIVFEELVIEQHSVFCKRLLEIGKKYQPKLKNVLNVNYFKYFLNNDREHSLKCVYGPDFTHPSTYQLTFFGLRSFLEEKNIRQTDTQKDKVKT